MILKMNEVILSSLAESTRTIYGAGLLRFTEFCDMLAVPEDRRMPASAYLLSAFMAHHAGVKSESCVDNWMLGIRQWHVINDAPWHGDDQFVAQVKRGVAKMAPPHKPPRNPVTMDHMRALQKHLNFNSSFDVAIWAVATCAFWGCCRLGELTVEYKNLVNGKYHVLRYVLGLSTCLFLN